MSEYAIVLPGRSWGGPILLDVQRETNSRLYGEAAKGSALSLKGRHGKQYVDKAAVFLRGPEALMRAAFPSVEETFAKHQDAVRSANKARTEAVNTAREQYERSLDDIAASVEPTP